ncbi:MAG: outer membrane beta-barrel protein [Chitinophagaceae bacterium]|nr:outer membrane beta-barrel protein [Chitinophagaceae bacterium]
MNLRAPVILILLVIPLLGHSQLLQAVAGTAVSKTTGTYGYETISGNMLAGYKIGLTADLPLQRGSSCGLRTGLFLDRWGSRFVQGTTGRAGAIRSLGFSYLQSPLLFIKRWGLSLPTGLLVGAGGYAAWRINEPSQIFKVNRAGNHVYGALYPDDGSGRGFYRRMDYGLSFHCSVEMHNRLNICLQYDHGLQNILRQSNGTALRNRALTLSLGYYLNQGRFLYRQFPLSRSIAK